MNKTELARGLVELWELYLRKSWPRSFQPTMTDFIEWLQDNFLTNEPEVKSTRTTARLSSIVDQDGNVIAPAMDIPVNEPDKVEASVAKHRSSDTLNQATEAEIRKLYKQGHSAARIRQMLELDDVPLSRIYSICNKR